MALVQMGDTVQVHYTGRFEDGTTFDSSRQGDPLRFTLGAGEIIAGFEEAILGMAEGDTKTVSLPPEKAYGERREELLITVPRSEAPEGMPLVLGMELALSNEEGQTIPVTISDVTETTLTLDANSPMAGKTLIFDLELVKIST